MRFQRDLLESAKRLEHRVYPLFADLERGREEKAEMLKKISDLKRSVRETKELRREVASLRADLRSTSDKYKSTVEAAGDRLVQELEENARLNKLVQKFRRAAEKKDQSIQALEDTVVEKEKQVRPFK